MKQQFLHIISKNEKLILKVCNIYCQESADREDLYQDIIVQLWKSFPKFEARSSVSTWLYRIALNVAISRYRKQLRQPEYEGLNDTLPPTDPSKSDNDDAEALYQAIAKLTSVEKAITMLYMEGVQYRQIGEIMNLTESNVGFKINAIKKKLKQLLQR